MHLNYIKGIYNFRFIPCVFLSILSYPMRPVNHCPYSTCHRISQGALFFEIFLEKYFFNSHIHNCKENVAKLKETTTLIFQCNSPYLLFVHA